ncbi:lytic murein transglycosylase [Subtercola endophyticus]|uniref:lytic murein transglycosylase n=1 Tax=Subtercola endophyticus TaxID=2895559 RepID=UPI001E54FA99|nr:lytic murein transglycosylase [Subtercola endophyticus]UFS59209.1 lytic murein transglycosylase [Subtercola endophyticus]
MVSARAVLKTGLAVLAISFIGYVAVNAAPAFGASGGGRVVAGEAGAVGVAGDGGVAGDSGAAGVAGFSGNAVGASAASGSAPQTESTSTEAARPESTPAAAPAALAEPTSPAAPADRSEPTSPAAPGPHPASAAPLPPGGNAGRVDGAWAAQVALRTGIPARAVLGYAGAALALGAEQPSCHLGWNTLAALGDIESGHGTHAGSSLNAAGIDTPGVFGPALDGGAYARVADSDAGALDGSSSGDRAVGPLQFIPSTWAQWGADGNGDGRDDPQQIDDAALAAGRYLCSYGDLSSAQGWRASVFAYNHVDSYVDAVASTANAYAAAAAG